MDIYQCYICGFATDKRSQIHKHHIIPRQARGAKKKSNEVFLCATCHSLVYSAYAKSGIHSIKGEKSFEILGWKRIHWRESARFLNVEIFKLVKYFINNFSHILKVI